MHFSKSKKKYKAWFYTFFLLNVALLSLTLISNPYRLTPINITIPGINDVKPKLYDYQRYVKLFDIARIKPKTIILGSSRVLWGIDPNHPLLKTYPPVYNAGIMGPPMYEIHEYFKHALANQPDLKRVVLALDFYAFNAKFDNRDLILQDIFGKNEKEIFKARKDLFFDFGAILESLWYSAAHKKVKSLRSDGRLIPDPILAKDVYQEFFNPPRIEDDNDNSVEEKKTTTGKEKVVAQQMRKNKVKQMRSELYDPFTISNQSMNALKELIKTCKDRNIELIIYITPTLNNSELSIYMELKIWKDFQFFETELAKLHPFWDFISWNEITMDKNNFVDFSHHIFSIGNKMIERIFNQENPSTPASFGQYVTVKNVHHHLKKLLSEFHLNKDSYASY